MNDISAGQMDLSVPLADTANFAIGDLEVRPALRSVRRGEAERILQPRVMQVLIVLAQSMPDVVSRDRLIARCWGGRVVGDDALNRCIVILRTVAREMGNCFEIQNVSRVGYRLAFATGTETAHSDGRRINRIAALAPFILVVAALSLFWFARPLQRNPDPGIEAAKGLVQHGRTLLRTGNPQVAADARVQFELATQHDPASPAAWVGLAEAIRSEASLAGAEGVIAVLPMVRQHLRRALKIDSDNAEAHLLMGSIMGYTSPEARRHLRLAASLDPESAEAQVGLADALRAEGDFAAEMGAFRRAATLDSDWYRPARDLTVATAEMGDRERAVALAETVNLPSSQCSGPRARIAWIFGDLSEAARCSAPDEHGGTIWSEPARVRFESAKLTLGITRDGTRSKPIHVVDTRPPQGRVWLASPPSRATWRARNRNADAALAWRLENFVAAKMMLNAGRAEELAATYDSSFGLLGITPTSEIATSDLASAALVALALQRMGREREARAVIYRADALIARVRSRGRAPFTFDRDAAAVAAARGDTERAIADLRKARSRGWVNDDWGDLLDIREEPAFASLLADPRFIALANDLDRLYQRERREFVALRL